MFRDAEENGKIVHGYKNSGMGMRKSRPIRPAVSNVFIRVATNVATKVSLSPHLQTKKSYGQNFNHKEVLVLNCYWFIAFLFTFFAIVGSCHQNIKIMKLMELCLSSHLKSLSPHLKSLSPHVANGDRVEQRCIRQSQLLF